jgi:hypothetical protein
LNIRTIAFCSGGELQETALNTTGTHYVRNFATAENQSLNATASSSGIEPLLAHGSGTTPPDFLKLQ